MTTATKAADGPAAFEEMVAADFRARGFEAEVRGGTNDWGIDVFATKGAEKVGIQAGGGKPVGHQGGRYLWQLGRSGDLLVAWRTEVRPGETESRLLADFRAAHGQLPFANLRH